jgi:hypothetical protein
VSDSESFKTTYVPYYRVILLGAGHESSEQSSDGNEMAMSILIMNTLMPIFKYAFNKFYCIILL